MIPCLCKQDLGQDGASRGLKWSVGWLPLLTISSLPFKGCWGSLGMSSSPSSSLGLWQLLPSQTTGPESGVSSQEGIFPHLPQGPQDSEKCEGWVSAELPALGPGLSSFFLPPCFQLSFILTKVSRSLVFCLFPSQCHASARRVSQWVPGKEE